MTINAYRKITARSEVDLLLSTAMDALADDLRFARNVAPYGDPGEPVPFTYISDSFAGTILLELDGDGRIVAMDTDPGGTGKRFLSTGVYGARGADGKRAYKVTEMTIDYNDPIFTINLKVQSTADSAIEAGGKLTVRCLNP